MRQPQFQASPSVSALPMPPLGFLTRPQRLDAREVHPVSVVHAFERAIEMAVVGVNARSEKRLLAGRQKTSDRRPGLQIAREFWLVGGDFHSGPPFCYWEQKKNKTELVSIRYV